MENLDKYLIELANLYGIEIVADAKESTFVKNDGTEVSIGQAVFNDFIPNASIRQYDYSKANITVQIAIHEEIFCLETPCKNHYYIKAKPAKSSSINNYAYCGA